MSEQPEQVWCTSAELADWWGVSVKTIAAWRKPAPDGTRRGPKFVKEGRVVRYLWRDVYAWANQQRKAG